MVYEFVFLVFIVLLVLFLIYKSYFFQFYLHKYHVKKRFLDEFKAKTKGIFIGDGYFASSHKIISKKEYKHISNKEKINFSKCYNIIIFKTVDTRWELFFHLIKEGFSFTEILNIRAFPNNETIKSEGNIEKTYGRINVFTNNHYLTRILEREVNNYVMWLMRYDGDMLLISENNLHFKAFMKKKMLSPGRMLDIVKAINGIRKKIYKKGVIEY